MKIFGLTGKTGAGKTTVSKLFEEKGFYVIDGDITARKITKKGQDALKELSEEFGKEILLPDGGLNRKALALLAFKDKESTKRLNEITHPKIKLEFEKEIESAKLQGYNGVLIDAAALLESDCRELCEKIIVVTSPENIRLERILKRDDITPEEAWRRIKAQFPDEYYFKKADIIIKNYPPFDSDIKKEITEFLEKENEA